MSSSHQNTGRKLVVSEWVTLDGVFDADTMDQWFTPYDSPERGAYIRAGILACDAQLLGRTTYEMLAPHWSVLHHNEEGIADKLNSVAKYVVSSTLTKAEWHNSTIIRDNAVDAITKLKQQPGQDILLVGSATLVQSLTAADLIDEFRFLVHPIIMGRGKRFFQDGMVTPSLQLVSTQTYPAGVVALVYQPIKG